MAATEPERVRLKDLRGRICAFIGARQVNTIGGMARALAPSLIWRVTALEVISYRFF
jgi:hypothetical protein